MSPEQVQVEEESLLKAREMDLDVLAQDNSTLLGDIAKVFTQSQCLTKSQCLTRDLAVKVLQAEVTRQLLDLDALYSAQVRGVPGVVCEPVWDVILHPIHENRSRLSLLFQMGESSILSCRGRLFLRGAGGTSGCCHWPGTALWCSTACLTCVKLGLGYSCWLPGACFL
jgi:hypothetical protein